LSKLKKDFGEITAFAFSFEILNGQVSAIHDSPAVVINMHISLSAAIPRVPATTIVDNNF